MVLRQIDIASVSDVLVDCLTNDLGSKVFYRLIFKGDGFRLFLSDRYNPVNNQCCVRFVDIEFDRELLPFIQNMIVSLYVVPDMRFYFLFVIQIGDTAVILTAYHDIFGKLVNLNVDAPPAVTYTQNELTATETPPTLYTHDINTIVDDLGQSVVCYATYSQSIPSADDFDDRSFNIFTYQVADIEDYLKLVRGQLRDSEWVKRQGRFDFITSRDESFDLRVNPSQTKVVLFKVNEVTRLPTLIGSIPIS